MAIAGRSYPNVPVISRGSLEDAADFGSRTAVLVVTSQPAQAQAAARQATVIRGTLQDPPVLTTAAPVVVAAAADRRWFAGTAVQVLGAPQAPAVTPAAAPGPVVVAAPYDRRWYAAGPVLALAAPQAPATAPAPVVVAVQVPWPRTVQAFITRGTLADPPVLTTPGPVMAAAQPDRRWFATRPPLVASGSAPFTPPPPAAGRGLLLASWI